PVRIATRQRRIVNNSHPSPDADEFEVVPRMQALRERDDLLDGKLEWPHLRQLRSNMHLQPYRTNVAEAGAPRVDGLDPFEGNAELILVRAGGDLRVSARVDIGIHPHRHRCHPPDPPGDTIDPDEFRFTLDIEAINTL